MLDVDEHGGAAPPPPVAAAAAAAAVPAGASDAALQPSAAGHAPLPWPQGLPLAFGGGGAGLAQSAGAVGESGMCLD